jgi:6-methylsalicylate decarboxylase
MEELNRRKAVIYVHPSTANCGNLVPRIPGATIEYGTDTTRAFARMVFGGSNSFPGATLIFSHGSGTMPYLVERFEALAKWQPDHVHGGFRTYAARSYYDTAQASNSVAMMALRHLVSVDHILSGIDFPYRTARDMADRLERCGAIKADELSGVDRENALTALG